MKRMLASITTGALLGGLAATGHADLVAQWTFNAGDASDLTSDVGGFTFSESSWGDDQTTTYNGDGTLSIGAGRGLYATGINATDLSGLKANATIWARMSIDSVATIFSPQYGLVEQTEITTNTGFDPYALAVWHNPDTNTERFTVNDGDGGRGSGPSAFIDLPASGTLFDLAITYQDDGIADNMAITTMYSGEQVITNPTMPDPLLDFLSFAVGRMQQDKTSGAMTFDEIRIYDEVLTAEQIAAIVPVVAGGDIDGDYNDSGLVEQGDLDQVLANWGAAFDAIPGTWVSQRPTEGIVDQAELDVVLTEWGSSSAPDFSGSAVPEPTTLALLGAAGVLAARRRR